MGREGAWHRYKQNSNKNHIQKYLDGTKCNSTNLLEKDLPTLTQKSFLESSHNKLHRVPYKYLTIIATSKVFSIFCTD